MRIQYENCTSGASSLKATISDKYFPSFIRGIPLQKKKEKKHKEQSILSTSQQNVHYCEALKSENEDIQIYNNPPKRRLIK